MADYITKAGAKFDAIYNGPNIGLKGYYNPQYNAYAIRPKENVVTQDGSFGIELNRWFQKLFKNGEMTVSEDFTFTPELKDYYFDEQRAGIGSLSNYGIRTRRSAAFRNAFGLNMTPLITRRLNLFLSYSNLLTNYRDPSFADNVTNAVKLGMGYAFPRDTIYSNITISNLRADKEDSNIYSLVGGIRHSISNFILFDVNIGGSVIKSDTGNSEATFIGGATFTQQSISHNYSAGYSRNLNTASGISSIPTTADIFYININNIHSKDVISNIGANYSINKSHRGDLIDTRSYNLSGALTYTIRKWLRCSITASHFNQDSKSLTVIEVKRDMITLALLGTLE